MSKSIFERMSEARHSSRQCAEVLGKIGMGAEIAQYAKLAEKLFWKDPEDAEAINIQRKLGELQSSLDKIDSNEEMSNNEKEREKERLVRAALDDFETFGVMLNGDNPFRGTTKQRIEQKYGKKFLINVESMGSED